MGSAAHLVRARARVRARVRVRASVRVRARVLGDRLEGARLGDGLEGAARRLEALPRLEVGAHGLLLRLAEQREHLGDRWRARGLGLGLG